MRQKFKVPLYGNPNRAAVIPVGAQIGLDLYMPDGTLATLAKLAAEISTSSSSSGGSGGIGPLARTLWSLIQDIPPNILEAAALSSTGLVTRKSTGDWITSVIQGTAGRIDVTHGDGNLGDPTIDLAAVSQGAGGALRRITIDAYGRITANALAVLDDLNDVDAPTPVDGYVLTWVDADDMWEAKPAAGGGLSVRSVTWTRGDLEIATPVPVVDLYISEDSQITAIVILTDGGSGSCVVDIWRDDYASFPPTVADTIFASGKPTISGGLTYRDSTLSGVSIDNVTGDVLRFNLDSSSTFTRITVSLVLQKV